MLNQYFGNLNSQQLSYSKAIFQSSNALLQNIKTMLDLSAIKAGKVTLNLHPIDISQLLTSVINTIQETSESTQIKINTSFASHVQYLVADEWRLKQALLGLISNAIQASPANGKIHIEVKTNHNSIFIQIIDSGVGIAANDQHRIFELFERTETSHQRYAGAGVGLPLSKSIIELHKGEISVTSTPNQGTTITCRLPLNLPQSAQQNLPKIA